MSSRTNDPGVFTDANAAVAPVERLEPPPDPRRFFHRPHQTRVVVRKLGPWSVFKFSLLFYFCIMMVILLALGLLYSVLGAMGAVQSMTDLLRSVGLVEAKFSVNGGRVFTWLALVGVAMVVIWSAINVFVVFLYNLISDVVGGVEVTLAERR
jgi:hypothetical protein